MAKITEIKTTNICEITFFDNGMKVMKALDCVMIFNTLNTLVHTAMVKTEEDTNTLYQTAVATIEVTE